MTRTSRKSTVDQQGSSKTLGTILLGLCLALLTLRATYTEAAVAQTFTVPGGLTDTLYSLVLSGVLILALATWFVWGVLQGQITYRITGMEIGLVILILAGIVSTWAAADKRLAVTQAVVLLGPVLGAVVLVQVLDSTVRIRAVLLTLGALGIVSAYQCAEQRFISNEVMIQQYEEAPETLLEPLGVQPGTFQHFLFEHRLYSRGVRGFFTTSNSTASFVLMASFAAMALLLGPGSKNKIAGKLGGAPLRILATVVIVGGLFLTKSKGGIGGFLFACVLFGTWYAFRHRLAAHRRTARIALVAVGLTAVAALTLGVTAYGLRHGRLPGGNSMLVRWQYWRASAQMLADAPLTGVGAGNFAHSYPRYKPAAAPESVADPHSFPLSLLTQYGPLGLIGFLLMVFVPLWRSAGRRQDAIGPDASNIKPPRDPAKTIMLVIAGVFVGIRPMLISTSGINSPDLLLYEIVVLYIAPAGAFLIGYLMLMRGRPQTESREDIDGGLVQALLACAVLGVLLHNLIDFALFEPGVWTALWILIACLVATGDQQANVRAKTLRATPPMKLLTAVIALAIVALYGHYVLRPVQLTTQYMDLAHSAMATGRIDRAHDLLDAASAADPASATTLNLNGRLYLQEYEEARPTQLDLLEKAAACFAKATEVDPADYKNYEKAAIAYSLMGADEQAYDWYLKATQRYPGCGRIWFGLAQVADRLGKTDSAVEFYQKAVEIEDAFREQFHVMYPNRPMVSRLGEAHYQQAKQRIEELSRQVAASRL